MNKKIENLNKNEFRKYYTEIGFDQMIEELEFLFYSLSNIRKNNRTTVYSLYTNLTETIEDILHILSNTNRFDNINDVKKEISLLAVLYPKTRTMFIIKYGLTLDSIDPGVYDCFKLDKHPADLYNYKSYKIYELTGNYDKSFPVYMWDYFSDEQLIRRKFHVSREYITKPFNRSRLINDMVYVLVKRGLIYNTDKKWFELYKDSEWFLNWIVYNAWKKYNNKAFIIDMFDYLKIKQPYHFDDIINGNYVPEFNNNLDFAYYE